MRIIGIFAALVLALSAAAASATTPDAAAKIDRALASIGGDLNGAARFADATVGAEIWMLEQTGDLNGGWSRYTSQAELHLDLVGRAGDVSSTTYWPIIDQAGGASHDRFGTWGAARRAQDGSWTYASAPARRRAERYLDLFPGALLLQARAASDASVDSAGRVAFTRGSERVALIFHADTGTLSGFEIRAAYPDDTFLAPWGEVMIRGTYAFWHRDSSGVTLPRQTSLTLDGRPWQLFEISHVALRRQFDADLSQPALPSAAPPAPSVLPVAFNAHREQIGPNVFAYRGAWGVGVLEREHDLVVFDAVISPAYTRALEVQLAQDFPGKRVAAAFTTSNSWPHAAGVGGYAADNIPIYGMAANRDLINTFIERAGARRNTFRAVRNGFRLDDDIIVRAPTGPELRNMMFLVIPDANFVWASDAMQLDEDGAIAVHARQYVVEMLQAVCSDIRPDTLFLAMHAGPVRAVDLAHQFAQEPNPPCAALLN